MLTVILSLSLYSNAQVAGCTDSQANNYDSNATLNDGSCLYDQTNYSPVLLIDDLPNTVRETSGLIYFAGGIWTHNDSGGDPYLYKLDLNTGSIIQTITVNNVTNNDWEELAQDDTYIYIGDFGNNDGDRKDLKIYKLPKSDIPSSGDASVDISTINFSYPDQTDFTHEKFKHDYDCESMISLNDSLYLFSKNWVDNKTRLYAVPKTPGIYIASLKDSFDVNGMITGATINSDSTICLIGYDDTDPFIWLLFNYTGSNLLSGNKRRIDLLGMGEFQTEAIGFVDGSKYYISNENNFASTANVYEFYTVQWITGIENDNRITANDRLQYSVYPNPTTSMINIDFHGNFDRVIVKLMDAMGRLMFTSTLNNLSSHQMDLNISHLEQGIYFLEITVDQVQHSVKKIIIN